MAMPTWWQKYVTKDALAGTIREFVESIDPLPLECCFCAFEQCENCRMQGLDTNESYTQEIVRQVNVALDPIVFLCHPQNMSTADSYLFQTYRTMSGE